MSREKCHFFHRARIFANKSRRRNFPSRLGPYLPKQKKPNFTPVFVFPNPDKPEPQSFKKYKPQRREVAKNLELNRTQLLYFQ